MVLKEIGSYPTFDQAFKAFFDAVKAQVDGGTTWQVLETTCRMTCDLNISGQKYEMEMDWYECRDWAYHLGLMNEKHLVDPLPEIKPELAFAAFAAAEKSRALAIT